MGQVVQEFHGYLLVLKASAFTSWIEEAVKSYYYVCIYDDKQLINLIIQFKLVCTCTTRTLHNIDLGVMDYHNIEDYADGG